MKAQVVLYENRSNSLYYVLKLDDRILKLPGYAYPRNENHKRDNEQAQVWLQRIAEKLTTVRLRSWNCDYWGNSWLIAKRYAR